MIVTGVTRTGEGTPAAPLEVDTLVTDDGQVADPV